MPAYLGGRSNSWRRLNLEGKILKSKLLNDNYKFNKFSEFCIDLPKNTVFYDVMNYALNKKMSDHLFKQLPVLLMQPNSTAIQMEQMRLITKIE
jgi:hypothetical protein